jgi:hypothetical protein
MSESIGFSKSALDLYASKFGFVGVDDLASKQVEIIVNRLVFNLLGNVAHIVGALKVKRVKKEHFEGMIALLHSHNIQVGGHAGTILPSEYFGISSGRYFTDVGPYESSSFAPGVSRAEIPIKFPGMLGGATAKPVRCCAFINAKYMKSIVKKYKDENKMELSVTSSAIDVIMSSVSANLDNLFKACAKSSRSKAPILIRDTILQTLKKKTNLKLAHMS